MNYDKLFDIVQKYKFKKYSTLKRMKSRSIDNAVSNYNLYFYHRTMYYDYNVSRKFDNHLRYQGKQDTTLQHVHKRYQANKLYNDKGKGIFSVKIYIDSDTISNTCIVMRRNHLVLEVLDNVYDITNKNEMFIAYMEHPDVPVIDVDKLVQLQEMFKKKPSGTYYIHIFGEN